MLEKNLIERWNSLSTNLETKINLNPLGEELLKRYKEPQRFYHDIHHLKYVLDMLDDLKILLIETNEISSLDNKEEQELFTIIELALWYHDSVYNPLRDDNEEKSAELFLKQATEYRINKKIIENVTRLILLTKNHLSATILDEKIMADCDLASFGRNADYFKIFGENIRKEYKHLDPEVFQKENKRILEKFFNAKPIFKTKAFNNKYEEQAKANLKQALGL